jgi:hypothetical protein
MQPLGVSVHPGKPVTEAGLDFRVAGHHEIYKLADPGFARPWCPVARDDQFGQALESAIFCRRKKLWFVGRPRTFDQARMTVLAGKDPALKSTELTGGCSQ